MTPSLSSSLSSLLARPAPGSRATCAPSCSNLTGWPRCRRASRDCLLEYWAWLGVSKVPQDAAIPLGIDAAVPAPVRALGGVQMLLCVGSIEGRKNHAALLDACESLWARDAQFELRLIGLANTETGAGALAKIDQLRLAGRPIRYDGPANDRTLEAAYRECAFTVYPSLSEGFGLPVAESLARGRACLCRTEGALGEIARGGGCGSLGAAGAAEVARPPSGRCFRRRSTWRRLRPPPARGNSRTGHNTCRSFGPGWEPSGASHD